MKTPKYTTHEALALHGTKGAIRVPATHRLKVVYYRRPGMETKRLIERTGRADTFTPVTGSEVDSGKVLFYFADGSFFRLDFDTPVQLKGLYPSVHREGVR